jgi:hypothetical protein
MLKAVTKLTRKGLVLTGPRNFFRRQFWRVAISKSSSSPSLSQGRSFRSVSISGRDICRPFTCVAAEHARLVIIYLVYQL